MQESGKRIGGESGFRCPDAQVMVAREHQGDENGETRYQCATIAYNGVSLELGPANSSGWLQESGKDSGDKSQYVCPPNTVMVGRDHQGDENGNTQYWCAPVNYEDAPLALRTKTGSGSIRESGKDSGGTSSYSCPANQVMVGRRHQGDENGYTWYLCADILWDHTPLLRSPPYQGPWIQESGKNSGGTSSFVCPAGSVITGRIHKGDENGNTMYQCSKPWYRGVPPLLRNAAWGDWIQESGKQTGGMSSFSCPASQVMTGRQHRGDENGDTRYQCASLFERGSMVEIVPLAWGPWLQESGKNTHGESYFACGTSTFMVGREHKGDENGETRYRCASASFPFSSTLSSAYRLAYDKVGDPAILERASFVSRADMGLSDDYFLHVDVGGEGFHTYEGVISGFAGAININAQTRDSQPPYYPIPLLIHVEDWSTSPPYPFADGTVNYVTMQGAPLLDSAVPEFARILAPGGQIGLWINMRAYENDVTRLAKLLQSEWKYSCSSGKKPCSNACIDEFYDSSDLDFTFPKVCIFDRRKR
ncbi:hypothetical protein BOSP111201_15360 [Bordetella sputigena]